VSQKNAPNLQLITIKCKFTKALFSLKLLKKSTGAISLQGVIWSGGFRSPLISPIKPSGRLVTGDSCHEEVLDTRKYGE